MKHRVLNADLTPFDGNIGDLENRNPMLVKPLNEEELQRQIKSLEDQLRDKVLNKRVRASEDDHFIRIMLDPPATDHIYGYVYIDPEVIKVLKIINEFNTFAEIWSTLKLFDRSKWFLSWHVRKSKMIGYEIRGNGFLKRMEDETK